MNNSSEIFSSNSSDHLSFNDTVVVIQFKVTTVTDLFTILWNIPINVYVIWLIVRGTGNGVASEIFNLNLAVCDVLFHIESILEVLGYKYNFLWIDLYVLDGLGITGRPLFQCVICVERYLAVVHPVTFLKYKPLRYRLICCVIVWLIVLVSCGICFTTFILFSIRIYISFLCAQFLFFLVPQLFFCVAVLRALKQSGPGEREEENHTKRRAFYFILISNVSMITIYTCYIIVLFVNILSDSAQKFEVLPAFCYFCYNLAGLVQPLLFLYRVEKLPFCKY